MSRPVIIPTGTANTASVIAAFSRLGSEPIISDDAMDVTRAEHVVLPGVGSFGAAATAIDRLKLRTVLVNRIRDGRATLAICVGMQLLAEASSESPGTRGLGVFAGEISRFARETDAPQLGWNTVLVDPGSRFLESGWGYFANSYRLTTVPDGWLGATTDHGGTFISALERGATLACQFHPELSGPWGARILSRWMAESEGVS